MSEIETEYELTLQDYIEIVRRRAVIILAVFLSILGIATVLAVILPPLYQSSGTILIESQQISPEIVASSVTGYANERVEVVKQRVMTRDNLLNIIKKYKVFEEEKNNSVTSELIDNLENRITVEMLNPGDNRRRGRQGTIAFSISFEDRKPKLAYDVTNELVTLFLAENVKSRVRRATETTQFLSQEAKRLREDLEKMESMVAAFRQKHSKSLPENLALKTAILQRTETSLANLDREYSATKNELQRLELELSAAKEAAGIADTPAAMLRKLKEEYRQARINYKDTHPTIRSLKSRIESLEKQIQEEPATAKREDDVTDNEVVLRLQTLITTAKGNLKSIEAQRKPMRENIKQYEKQILETPQVELGLSKLMRDHNTARQKYEEIQEQQLNAQIAENLEGENKSERFTLIDPPLLADKPIKPNRIKILLIGIFLAIASALGLAFLLEVLNQRIRGKGALTVVMGHRPLVEIPYITTNDEITRRKHLKIKVAVGFTVLVLVTLLATHFLYIELDLLIAKIFARF